MASTAHVTSYIERKQQFFRSVKTTNQAWDAASQLNYNDIAPTRLLIEEDLNQLSTVIDLQVNRTVFSEKDFNQHKENSKKNEEYWLYCYYCTILLQKYYNDYEQKEKAARFEALRKKIGLYCENQQNELTKNTKEEEKRFLQFVTQSLRAAVDDIIATITRPSQLRAKITLANAMRIYWIFCRMGITQSLLILKGNHWLDKLDKLLRQHTNVKKMIAILQAPGIVTNVLSVGYFAARFAIDFGFLLKHVYLPSKGEKKQLKWDRFTDELYKRHADFLNNIVWGVVNGLTNYAHFFAIPAPVAMWVVAGFLYFDVALYLWRRELVEKEYQIKRSQYKIELYNYEQQLINGDFADEDEEKKILERQNMTLQQMRLHEINYKAKSATQMFNVTAAGLLAVGFTASMLLGPAAMIAACYFVGMIGVAMYLSADAFGNYREKKMMLEEFANPENKEKLEKEYREARNAFIITMAKNTIMPTLIIATFIICWQAALVLTALYVAYELWSAYKNSPPKPTPLPVEGELINMDEDEEADEEASSDLELKPA